MPFNALRNTVKYTKEISVNSLVGNFLFTLIPIDGSFHRALDIYYKLNVATNEESFSNKLPLTDLLCKLFTCDETSDTKYFYFADNHFTNTVKRYLDLSGSLNRMFIKPSCNWIRKSLEFTEYYTFVDFNCGLLFYDVIDQLYGIGEIFQIKESEAPSIRIISEFFKDIVKDGKFSTKGKILEEIHSRIFEVEDAFCFENNDEMIDFLYNYKKDFEIKGNIFEEDINYELFVYYIGLWNVYAPNDSIRRLQQPYMSKTLYFECSSNLKSFVNYSVSVILGAIYDLVNASVTEICYKNLNVEKVIFMTEEISFDMSKKYAQVEPNFNTATTVLHLPDRSVRLIKDNSSENISFINLDMRAGIEREHPIYGPEIQLTQIRHASQSSTDDIYKKDPGMFSILAILSELMFPDNIADYENLHEEIYPIDENNIVEYWSNTPLLRNHSYKELKHLVTEVYYTIHSYLKFHPGDEFMQMLFEVVCELFDCVVDCEKLSSFYEMSQDEIISTNVIPLIINFVSSNATNCNVFRRIIQGLHNYRWKFDLVLILGIMDLIRKYHFNQLSINIEWFVELILRDFDDSIENYSKYIPIVEKNLEQNIHSTMIYKQNNYTDDNYFKMIFNGIDVQNETSLDFISKRLNDLIVDISTIYMDVNAMRVIENAPIDTYFIFYGGSYHGDLYEHLVRIKENSQ